MASLGNRIRSVEHFRTVGPFCAESLPHIGSAIHTFSTKYADTGLAVAFLMSGYQCLIELILKTPKGFVPSKQAPRYSMKCGMLVPAHLVRFREANHSPLRRRRLIPAWEACTHLASVEASTEAGRASRRKAQLNVQERPTRHHLPFRTIHVHVAQTRREKQALGTLKDPQAALVNHNR